MAHMYHQTAGALKGMTRADPLIYGAIDMIAIDMNHNMRMVEGALPFSATCGHAVRVAIRETVQLRVKPRRPSANGCMTFLFHLLPLASFCLNAS